MAYELFWIGGSPFAWRALLGLTAKGLEYESRLLQASEGEHKAPWFLEMNPRGKVPVLKDGATVVYESLAILAYLDAKHPEPPLLGRTAEDTARIWRVTSEAASYLRPAVSDLLSPMMSGELEKKAAEVKEGAKQVHAELGRLEEALGASPFIAGAEISAADVTAFPEFQFIIRASSRHEAAMRDLGFSPDLERYPRLVEWTKRIEALPGYDKTYPPHWR